MLKEPDDKALFPHCQKVFELNIVIEEMSLIDKSY